VTLRAVKIIFIAEFSLALSRSVGTMSFGKSGPLPNAGCDLGQFTPDADNCLDLIKIKAHPMCSPRLSFSRERERILPSVSHGFSITRLRVRK